MLETEKSVEKKTRRKFKNKIAASPSQRSQHKLAENRFAMDHKNGRDIATPEESCDQKR